METETKQPHTNEDTTCCSFVHSSRIHSSVLLVLILLAAFLFAETVKSFKEYKYVGGGISPSNAISVSGKGEVFAVPDTAEFIFTIREEALTAAEAQDAATKKANDAIKTLVEKGIEEKDIKTVNYNLSPKYEWKKELNCLRYPCPNNNKEQVGFTLTQSVRVKVHDLDRAGEMLELVTDKGISNVSGLTFTIADEDALRDDARKQAIDEARAKAEKLADDLGVSLERIVGFSEGGGFYTPTMYSKSMDAVGFGGGIDTEESVQVPAGENKVTSNVQITYEIR